MYFLNRECILCRNQAIVFHFILCPGQEHGKKLPTPNFFVAKHRQFSSLSPSALWLAVTRDQGSANFLHMRSYVKINTRFAVCGTVIFDHGSDVIWQSAWSHRTSVVIMKSNDIEVRTDKLYIKRKINILPFSL